MDKTDFQQYVDTGYICPQCFATVSAQPPGNITYHIQWHERLDTALNSRTNGTPVKTETNE